MKKALNVKQMKEAYIHYSAGDNNELEKIWETFAHMRRMGFISYDEWTRFYLDCGAWYWADDSHMVDADTGEEIAHFDITTGRMERS